MTASDYHRVSKSLEFLTQNMAHQPTLTDLGNFLGLSPSHCQRLFKRMVGISPKDFLQVLTLNRAKQMLQNGSTVLDTSMALGLSSTSRLYDLFLKIETTTPGDFKNAGANMNIHWDRCPTAFGTMIIAASARGLCAMWFEDVDSAAPPERELYRRWPHARIQQTKSKIVPFHRYVNARIQGKTDSSRIPLHLSGTNFQIKVWKALLTIPPGTLLSYGGIARLIGAPKASRAVGTAVGANPVAYLIPCHRVIRATGAVGGYRWGVHRKIMLLNIDEAHTRLRLDT